MTTPQEQALDHAELESAAAAVVGKIIFAFSRFEFELGLCLRNAVGGVDVDAVNPLIQRLNFKHKLDALLEVVAYKSASKTECVAEFRKWHRSIDALRTKRNSFVHGRWGVHSNAQQVINVAPGMPNSIPQRETRFTLGELQQELSEVERVVSEFHQLRERWHL